MEQNEILKSKLSRNMYTKDKESIIENVSQKELDLQKIMNNQFKNLEQTILKEGKEIQCTLKNLDLSSQIARLIIGEKGASDNLTTKIMVDKENQTDNQISYSIPRNFYKENQTENQNSFSVPRNFENEKSDPPKTQNLAELNRDFLNSDKILSDNKSIITRIQNKYPKLWMPRIRKSLKSLFVPEYGLPITYRGISVQKLLNFPVKENK